MAANDSLNNASAAGVQTECCSPSLCTYTTPSFSGGDMMAETLRDLYLDLLKETLVRWGDDEVLPLSKKGPAAKRLVKYGLNKAVEQMGFQICKPVKFDAEKRTNGRDWPSHAITMIGTKRLDNLRYCVETILKENVPGDVIETGVWRGGGSIFMRAILKAHGDETRNVWCADSFKGLPQPNVEKYPQDNGLVWHLEDELAVPLETVKDNFRKFDLLDDQVKFLPGWFKDTLGAAPIDKISVLRLDGDMYESTMDALNPLYRKLSPGGFVVIDDYGITQDCCRGAIHDFRAAHSITEPIIDIDGWGAYWRRAPRH
jgi:O-methyltransferase